MDAKRSPETTKTRWFNLIAKLGGALTLIGGAFKGIKWAAENYAAVKETIELWGLSVPWLRKAIDTLGSDIVVSAGSLVCLVVALLFWREGKRLREKSLIALPTQSEDPVNEVRVIETLMEARHIVEEINWKTYREERVYEYAATIANAPRPKHIPINTVDPNLIQRCHVLSLSTNVYSLAKLGTALRGLAEEVAKWNEQPNLDVRDMRKYTQQILPPVFENIRLEMESVFVPKPPLSTPGRAALPP